MAVITAFLIALSFCYYISLKIHSDLLLLSRVSRDLLQGIPLSPNTTSG